MRILESCVGCHSHMNYEDASVNYCRKVRINNLPAYCGDNNNPIPDFCPLPRVEIILCTNCSGDGYTIEHSGDKYCQEGDHSGCPIQEQCEKCESKGFIRI